MYKPTTHQREERTNRREHRCFSLYMPTKMATREEEIHREARKLVAPVMEHSVGEARDIFNRLAAAERTGPP